MAVLGTSPGQAHPAQTGATRLPGGLPIHQRFSMARPDAKNRLGRVDALSVPPGSARVRFRDQEAAGRPGMGLFRESSRVAKGQEGPRVSHFGESLEGDRENYRWLGVDWPENRYLVLGLSGDADIKTRKPMQTGVVNGWLC